MKRKFAILTLLIFIFSMISCFSEEIDDDITMPEEEDYIVEELGEIPLNFEDNEDLFLASYYIPDALPDETIQEYDYKIKLSNVSNYSIVALNNAYIDAHIRGSLWVGGTLTSNDWCGTDDGSISGAPSGNESYIYNNESSMYFQGRTENQSPDAYKILSFSAVESTRNYWQSFNFPNDGEEWIYVEPDANGYVNLCNWDYQNDGSDESTMSINKVYWTDAKKVDMGGLAGHLFAPFADIDITWCNHRGAIVGWNITTHGEAHVNYWKPEIPQEPTPAPGKIVLQKTLINDIWHIRCDVMDGTDFHAGGGIWKTDVIMNPTKQTSKEGHRSNKCGDADHWIIWLNSAGTPFRMDEIKSGATGGTLPTMIFQEVYSPQDLGLSCWGELEPEMTDKVELYKENFKIPKDITTVQPGERIYWVTWNGEQRWYHSGIPYVAPPTFTFYIDGEPYPIVAGHYLELEDVLPGAHEIYEDVSSSDYIITIFGATDIEGSTSMVNIIDGETIEVEYVNERIVPPTVQPSTPPTITPTNSPTPTPTITIEPTPTLTIEPTPTLTVEPTPTLTTEPTPTLTVEPTPTITVEPTPTLTIEPTPTLTIEPTPTLTIEPTPTITIEPTPTLTVEPTPTLTIEPTPTLTIEPTSTPTIEPTPTVTIEPTTTPTAEPSVTPTTEPSATPTTEPSATPTVEPSATPTTEPTTKPTVEPTYTPTVAPTETPTVAPTVEVSPIIEPTITPTPTETTTPPAETLPPAPQEVIVELTEGPTPSPTPTPAPTLPPEKKAEIIEYVKENPKPKRSIPFKGLTEEQFEELLDMPDYETPLYGMLQTGDETPPYIFYLLAIGIICILFLIPYKH